MESLAEKQKFLMSKITDRKIRYNYHDARTSHLEAVFARGDRRLGDALELAQREGMRFDAWEEFFDYDKWIDVIRRCGLDPDFYANRTLADEEILPWEIIECGVSKEFLLRERHKSQAGDTTPGCHEQCSGCGANGGLDPSACTWCPGGKSSKKKDETPRQEKTPRTPAARPTPGFSDPGTQKVAYRTIRVRFVKEDPALYIGHLDVARVMARVVTRSGLPVYYTEGYNPRPKLVFASPLSVGCGSDCEIMDIRVLPEVTDEEILTALKAAEIKGLTVTDAYEARSKLTEITDASYRLRIHSPKASAEYAKIVEERFRTPVIMMKKSKSGEKEVDITTLIRSLSASFGEADGVLVVDCTLACSSSEYLNPSYVADAIARETDLITEDTWHETVRCALLRADGSEFR